MCAMSTPRSEKSSCGCRTADRRHMPSPDVIGPGHSGPRERREPCALVFQKPQTHRKGRLHAAQCLRVPRGILRQPVDRRCVGRAPIRCESSDRRGAIRAGAIGAKDNPNRRDGETFTSGKQHLDSFTATQDGWSKNRANALAPRNCLKNQKSSPRPEWAQGSTARHACRIGSSSGVGSGSLVFIGINSAKLAETGRPSTTTQNSWTAERARTVRRRKRERSGQRIRPGPPVLEHRQQPDGDEFDRQSTARRLQIYERAPPSSGVAPAAVSRFLSDQSTGLTARRSCSGP